MGLRIEASDQEVLARKRVQQLEQPGALLAYFSSANKRFDHYYTHCWISKMWIKFLNQVCQQELAGSPSHTGWCGRGFLRDITHLDHIQV